MSNNSHTASLVDLLYHTAHVIPSAGTAPFARPEHQEARNAWLRAVESLGLAEDTIRSAAWKRQPLPPLQELLATSS